MNNYVVYTHSHDGQPFYVGMGKPARPYEYPTGRSEEWLDYYYSVNKQIDVQIVASGLNKEMAVNRESELINSLSKNNNLVNKNHNPNRNKLDKKTKELFSKIEFSIDIPRMENIYIKNNKNVTTISGITLKQLKKIQLLTQKNIKLIEENYEQIIDLYTNDDINDDINYDIDDILNEYRMALIKEFVLKK